MGHMIKLRRSHRRVLLAVGVCAALLVPPTTALAQDALSNPAAAQYQPQSQVQGTSTTGSNTNGSGVGAEVAAASTGPAANSSGTLPFTGMDLAVVAGIALLMIAVGLALRRLSAPRRA
jgi:hypothetical protein